MSTAPEDDWETTGKPWKEPGRFRRDCQSERGDLLDRLALAGFVPVLGLIPSVIAWRLARNDLREMDAGERDPAGKAKTLGALDMILATTIVNGFYLFLGAMFVFGMCV